MLWKANAGLSERRKNVTAQQNSSNFAGVGGEELARINGLGYARHGIRVMLDGHFQGVLDYVC